ncbi:acyltransferase GLAUCE-like [Nicotiana tabacum]|uniref:Acyltransferase GLAUCE-like n=1 Tax=Nicotiana tabacum TaxID=4097 RepID=A0A1S4D1T0_TOBAC|nr:PREDICTED: omega-hydroxypalmitate O-feruloyl transferase-like [Nicotiana tabacum]
MGTLYQPLESTIQELKVTIQDTSLVFPSEETQKKPMFLSNIDQVLNFDVQTLHFFPANSEFPPEIVKEKLRNALSKVLVPYDFLAGRLKMNHQIGRLEIDCNAEGAVFVVASSELTLKEIGDLVYPNPGFRQLITQSIDLLEKDDKPLCIIQVTSFKCGGFAMGTSTNHITFDGTSYKIFLQNLASQAFGDDKPLAIVPCNDRSLLAARSPPRVDFPHPELLKLEVPIGEELNPTVFETLEEELVFKIFKLNSSDISSLKDKAKDENAPHAKVTSFNVVTAYVWKCKALSFDVENNSERISTVLFAVDIRPRLNPPLPKSYTGNAVLTSYASATCHELEEWPFCKIVAMVSKGAMRMTDEYARSAIDWGEFYKGFPNGEFLISSWWRLGFSEVEYPWGKPKYSCPVVSHRKDIILLFPNIDDGITSSSNDGVNILVALPIKQMEKFESYFNKFLLA